MYHPVATCIDMNKNKKRILLRKNNRLRQEDNTIGWNVSAIHTSILSKFVYNSIKNKSFTNKGWDANLVSLDSAFKKQLKSINVPATTSKTYIREWNTCITTLKNVHKKRHHYQLDTYPSTNVKHLIGSTILSKCMGSINVLDISAKRQITL